MYSEERLKRFLGAISIFVATRSEERALREIKDTQGRVLLTFNNPDFAVVYAVSKDTAHLETTFSNRVVDDAWYKALTSLMQIVKSYNAGV